jgi:tRNA (guanine-N7-)-methyltransferase
VERATPLVTAHETVTMTTDQDDQRQGAFFGRRKGHPLRPRRATLMQSLLPRLAVDLAAAAPPDLTSLFPVAVDEVRLEIGFGGGEHLVAAAEQAPRTGFLGIEAFLNGMASALAAIEARQLANVRLHFGDVTPVLGWLPAGSLARVDLLYPDPWPKRRHWKRRLVQDQSVAQIARILRPGGELRFATDIPDYAAWTLAHLLRSPDFAWTAETADDWRLPWPGYAATRYERKAIQAGRRPCYLTFRRIEPARDPGGPPLRLAAAVAPGSAA